jgi:hypothetical protein
MTEAKALLVNSSHGVYVPKAFIEHYDPTKWQGISDDDIAILKAGPDHEHYWETWDDVLGHASFTEGRHKWTLHQDEDLWAICDALMTNDEYAEFFGEMKPAPDDAYEYQVCEDCLVALANNDYTGVSSAIDEISIRTGLDSLHAEYAMVIPDGADYGFTHANCDSCGALPGNRFRVICFKEKINAEATA